MRQEASSFSGFMTSTLKLMTRVTLDAKEAYQLLQWLADYHRDFLQAVIQ